jgi:RNA polymerase sigma-70 factor (ECF subfamily)
MTEGKPASAVTAQPAVFATTHWSVVLAAGEADTPQSSAALEKLCRTYWYPLYAHIRRRGYSEEEAKDLTQELFERLLERQFLCGLLREGGRFRSFLLTALDRFLVEHWQRSRAQKRGGGQPIVSIDAHTAEERYRLEPRDQRTPETIYEYRWAMALLDQVLHRLQQEFSEAGKDELFNMLRNYLVEGATEMSYAEGARRLGMSEAALRKAGERLRLRYQELFRQEIAHTVTSPVEVEDELRHLQTVMRG